MAISRKRYKVLYDATAAGTGNWIELDVRYAQHTERPIQVDMAAGDTVTIQGTTHDEYGIDKSFLTTLNANEITDIKSFIASGNFILDSNWTYIRVVKTGTNGPAHVAGFV